MLTPKTLPKIAYWMPSTCAYRLRADGRPLPGWHYLISGDRDAVRRVGVSVVGRVVSEVDAGPMEHHITAWPGPRAQWDSQSEVEA